MLKFLSVCSGIEAASVAWPDFQPLAFSEIAPFPSAVLKHHYPDVPNLGDLREHESWQLDRPDILIGGTPCQSFSVAGQRRGLDDPRGQLMFSFLGLAERLRPRVVVWENVPGVLSSNRGRDFGSFIGALGKLGFQWAYRVLDAQWFGVAQRRRRVFVVASSGDIDPRAVLFESESLCRDTPSRSKERQDDTGSTGDGVARCVTTGEMKRSDWETCKYVACFQQNSRSEVLFIGGDGNLTGSLTNAPGAQQQNYIYSLTPGSSRGESIIKEADTSTTILANMTKTGDSGMRIVSGYWPDVSPPLTSCIGGPPDPLRGAIVYNPRVRRLTATECERLQGFPDNYTNIPWRGKPESPDGLRIGALGNSMAVPAIRWLGERILKQC